MKHIVKINEVTLPEQVPYLNDPEKYLIGNGLVCGSGSISGKWDFVAGPYYTCTKYFDSEEIIVVINGEEYDINFEMHRARETGIYYGTATVKDLNLCLVDFTCKGNSYITRLLNVENKSSTIEYNVALRVCIKTQERESGIVHHIFKNMNGKDYGIKILQDTKLYSTFGSRSGWVPNFVDRYLTIALSNPSKIFKDKDLYILESELIKVSAGSSAQIALYHFMNERKDDFDYATILQAINNCMDLSTCINEWQSWFGNVTSTYLLNNITDKRARDIVEGGLSVIKTNQTMDGGLVANELWYNLSWTRDAYCGLRGLLAFGHTEESKDFLMFTHNKYMAHGFIPNSVSCGSNVFALYNGNEKNTPCRNMGGACPEANTAPETTALYILAARDYFNLTNDFMTLSEIHASLKYAMDIQLKHAIANGYRLEFSGDETELCGAVSTIAADYNDNLENYWSMSSIALCIASLEFYIQFIEEKGESSTDYISFYGKEYNLPKVLENMKNTLEIDFWRTDDLDCPEGYHEWCRIKSGFRFPKGKITNFTLFPIYYGTVYKFPERVKSDVNAIKQYFIPDTKSIPLVPVISDNRYLGHSLGYLLWCLIEADDNMRHIVYDALINGRNPQCFGAFNEAYDANGTANNNQLRTFETGVNLDAISKYWKIGN